MATLLIDRTTNQPRSVHSGHGDTSIAHGGWQAKSPVRGDLEKGVSIAYTGVTVQYLLRQHDTGDGLGGLEGVAWSLAQSQGCAFPCASAVVARPVGPHSLFPRFLGMCSPPVQWFILSSVLQPVLLVHRGSLMGNPSPCGIPPAGSPPHSSRTSPQPGRKRGPQFNSRRSVPLIPRIHRSCARVHAIRVSI